MLTESSTIREPSNISGGANDSFLVKKLFLSCLQAFFAEHTKYTWTTEKTTKINIVDKFAMDLTVASQRPTLVLSRGSSSWLYTSIGQVSYTDLNSSNTTYTDLMAGSVTINCMAKNGLVCEELAFTVRNVLTACRDQLIAKGLHQLKGISVGEERALSVDSDISVAVVPVTVQFIKQTTLSALSDFYTTDLKISFDGQNYGGYSGLINPEYNGTFQLFENRDYVVGARGFVFNSGLAPPSNSTLSVDYIEATSLTEVIGETPSGIIDGDNLTFTVEQTIYGHSPIIADIILVSGVGIV